MLHTKSRTRGAAGHPCPAAPGARVSPSRWARIGGRPEPMEPRHHPPLSRPLSGSAEVRAVAGHSAGRGLAALAREEGADLIVVGSDRRAGTTARTRCSACGCCAVRPARWRSRRPTPSPRSATSASPTTAPPRPSSRSTPLERDLRVDRDSRPRSRRIALQPVPLRVAAIEVVDRLPDSGWNRFAARAAELARRRRISMTASVRRSRSVWARWAGMRGFSQVAAAQASVDPCGSCAAFTGFGGQSGDVASSHDLSPRSRRARLPGRGRRACSSP